MKANINLDAPYIQEMVAKRRPFVCDICGKTKNAQVYIVSHKTDMNSSFELCRSCYADELLDGGVQPTQ